MDRVGGILLLFWLGVTEITSVTRFTSFLVSVPLSLTSLSQTLRGARRPCVLDFGFDPIQIYFGPRG